MSTYKNKHPKGNKFIFPNHCSGLRSLTAPVLFEIVMNWHQRMEQSDWLYRIISEREPSVRNFINCMLKGEGQFGETVLILDYFSKNNTVFCIHNIYIYIVHAVA